MRFVAIFFMCSALFAQSTVTRIVPSETVELRSPTDISLGSDGKLYIVDSGHGRVLSVNEDGELLSEIGSTGTGNGEFKWPRSIAAESGLSIWVADYGNRRIVKLSRLLEYQGSFDVRLRDSDRPEQVSQLAVSPLGDVFVYAEDSGQLLRYDPLFVLQAELGSLTGSNFIPRIRQIIHVKDIGVIWHTRGDDRLSMSDPMLTSVSTFPVAWRASDKTILCGTRSCPLAIDTSGVFRLCPASESVEEVVPWSVLSQAGINAVDAAAYQPGSALYLLESRAGAIYRVTADKL